MKKLLALLLCAALLCTTAMADVLVEVKDAFWEKHYQECESIYRAYTANGEKGYVTLFESPTSPKERENVPNGQMLDGQWHYTDGQGQIWLAVSGGYEEEGYNLCRGWVRVADCAAQPDHISFAAAHGQDFVGWDSAYANAFDGVTELVFWKYPGAAYTDLGYLTVDGSFKPDEIFVSYYLDETGRYWGFVEYFRGRHNAWICLDDPSAVDLPENPGILPAQTALIPAAQTIPAPSKTNLGGAALILVAVVVCATAVLIFVLFRKKRGQKPAD